MHLNTANIVVDLMGSDLGPEELLHGVKLLLDSSKSIPNLTLIGDGFIVEPLMKKLGMKQSEKLKFVHASQVVEMQDKPIQAVKQKKESSMMCGLDMVKEGKAHAMLSCGNTGALMAGGTIKLRQIPGILKPALSSIFPSQHHHFIIVDVGANPDTEPKHMVHNAILGSNYCKVVLGVEKPTIGLLSIGTEEGKGTDRILQTHEYLKELNGVINYTGLIEGYHVFDRDVDVIVCDGFVGNILIKSIESLFITAKAVFRDELTKNLLRKIGALLSRGAYNAIRDRFNPDKYSAAPFLGINGILLKAHGSSKRINIMYAIQIAAKMLNHDMNDQIERDVFVANEKMKSMDAAPSIE